MRIHKHISGFVALTLSLLLVVSTVPVSAADLTTRNVSIGSVSSVGSVSLRGVGIKSDGTLFSGDRLNVGSGAYAKVTLSNGPKVEVGAGSDVTVSRDANGITVQMASGNVAFSGNGQKPIHVRVGSFDVTASGKVAGTVGFVGSADFGVRVTTGEVTVQNVATKQSFKVQSGGDRLVSLQTGASRPSLVQLASSVPPPIPALPPQAGGSQAKKPWYKQPTWFAVIGGLAVAIGVASEDGTEVPDLVKTAKDKATANIQTTSNSADQAAAAAASVSTQSTAVATAINAANIPAAVRTQLLQTATSLTSQANATADQITALQAQLDLLQGQIDAATDPAAVAAIQTQINIVNDSLRSDVVVLNQQITALNDLIRAAQTAGVGNVNPPTLTPVPPVPSTSISVPL